MAGFYPSGTSKKLSTQLDNKILLPPFEADGFTSSAQFDGYPLPGGVTLSPIHTFGIEDPVLNPSCPKEKKWR